VIQFGKDPYSWFAMTMHRSLVIASPLANLKGCKKSAHGSTLITAVWPAGPPSLFRGRGLPSILSFVSNHASILLASL
jgi:hypothetical protein